MSVYKCYECGEKFNETKYIFHHLKNVHKIKEREMQIKCVNNFETHICLRTFLTFDGLRKHLDKCYLDNKKLDEMVKKKRKKNNKNHKFISIYLPIYRKLMKI